MSYNIADAFKAIENELIQSMVRNMDRHRAEEAEYGYNWSMWQAEQLQALDEYKKNNLKTYGPEFNRINSQLDELINMARANGNADQEADILEAIRKGFPATKGDAGLSGAFFQTNTRKLNALIDATKSDFSRAEYAMLRKANDGYRSAIFNAQVYANLGAGTYAKAVDMAVKDMVGNGLQCVQYKNGARHTLADYADMSIRTANKRAYLTGEGEKRHEWGLSLVAINRRGNACPKCSAFVGKVLVDNVWSGGKPDGKHITMSSAIDAGLYHPRCKDSHHTYYEGLSSNPEEYTDEEKQELVDDYNQEQKVNHAQKQQEKYARLASCALDPADKKTYQARADAYGDTIDYMSNSFRPDYEEPRIIGIDDQLINVKKVKNSAFDMLTDIDSTKRSKAVRLAEKRFSEIRMMLPDDFEFPTIAVVDFDKHGLNSGAIGGYHPESDTLFINSKFDTNKKILEYVSSIPGWLSNVTVNSPYLHELGHKYYYDCIKKVANSNCLSYNEAKRSIDVLMMNYIDGNELEFEKLSGYASASYQKGNFSEIIAESMGSELKLAVALLEMINK